jgi:malonyl-CoA O-methyltransferase
MSENSVLHEYPIMLLHGWGFSSTIWRPLMQALHEQDCNAVYAIDLPGFGSAFHESCDSLDQVLDVIIEQLPEKSVLCGWSLGGMLAIQIAARWPEKIAAVITIGSNLFFTQDEAWPGMPSADFQQFCQRFSAQPEKTWQRFLLLQTRNDSHADQAAAALALLADYSSIHPHTAGKMLALLGEMDNRELFATLSIPGLHCLGEHDAITPASLAPLLQKINAQQSVKILAGSAHALPASRPEQLASVIKEFLSSKKPSISKNRVAASFSKAAASYDHAAKLQRDVGSALLASLPDTMQGNVMDIGCGTGFIAGKLLEKYGVNLDVIGLDIAAGMLQRAQRKYPAATFLQADMECLPVAGHTADWLVSSLALQWANHPARCFHEWRRVLKPGGNLFFSTFLPGTLRELEQSWRTVDEGIHVNKFIGIDALLDALKLAGFTRIETFCAAHTLYYPQLRDLARELKAIGAHNMNDNQHSGLTGKSRWQQLQSAYECLRGQRGLPATYEVIYVSAA